MCAIIGFDSPTLTEQEIRPYFDRTVSRGPDMSRMEKAGRGMLGFHRLAIMGLHEEGMQPFHLGGDMAVCNGELYGFRPLKKELEAKGYTFASESDCELILPLYREYGVEMFAKLDAEFAMIIYDAKADRLVAARDPIGIRPLFYGYLADGGILFASEAKNLVGLCERIMPFPPGHYYADGKFVRYADLTTVTEYSRDDLDTVCKKIREKLIAGVEKRLDADAPLGFLLSGGLDSRDVYKRQARNESLGLIPADADICCAIDLDEQFHPGWRAALERAWPVSYTHLRNAGRSRGWRSRGSGAHPVPFPA